MRGLSGPSNAAWSWFSRQAAIGPTSRRAKRFAAFGEGSGVLFPTVALYGEQYIRVGARTTIGPYATLSAGVAPGHVPERTTVVSIGDDVLIGKGSGIVGHLSVEIGAGVFTGHHVYITDANHGYEDVALTIGRQFAEPRPVVVGPGSWLGHGCVVLPGANVGEHVVVGAGAVVSGEIPSFTVAVGNPARVVRAYDERTGKWGSV